MLYIGRQVEMCYFLIPGLKTSRQVWPRRVYMEIEAIRGIAAVMMYMGSSRGNWNILDSRLEFSRFSGVCKL